MSNLRDKNLFETFLLVVIKLDSNFLLIQGLLYQALDNWALLFFKYHVTMNISPEIWFYQLS